MDLIKYVHELTVHVWLKCLLNSFQIYTDDYEAPDQAVHHQSSNGQRI